MIGRALLRDACFQGLISNDENTPVYCSVPSIHDVMWSASQGPGGQVQAKGRDGVQVEAQRFHGRSPWGGNGVELPHLLSVNEGTDKAARAL